jgi:hypothetical protein
LSGRRHLARSTVDGSVEREGRNVSGGRERTPASARESDDGRERWMERMRCIDYFCRLVSVVYSPLTAFQLLAAKAGHLLPFGR